MRAARPLVTALAAVAALLLVSACDDLTSDLTSDKDAAGVGTLIETVTGVQGTASFVQLPIGRVDLTVSRPRYDLPTYDETYDRAADGASLVGVGWSWQIGTGVPGMRVTGEVEPHFVLVADGREYPLDEAMLARYGDHSVGTSGLDSIGSVFVAVAGEPEDLSITVEYDGLTQEVEPDFPQASRETGVASRLYGDLTQLATVDAPCGEPVVTKPFSLDQTTLCSAMIAHLPYVEGVGWADDDKGWIVVDLRVFQGSSVTWRRGGRRLYYPIEGDPVAPTATVDGAEAAATLDLDADGVDDRWVFPSSDTRKDLVVDRTLPTSGDGGGEDGAPVDPVVDVRWTFELASY